MTAGDVVRVTTAARDTAVSTKKLFNGRDCPNFAESSSKMDCPSLDRFEIVSKRTSSEPPDHAARRFELIHARIALADKFQAQGRCRVVVRSRRYRLHPPLSKETVDASDVKAILGSQGNGLSRLRIAMTRGLFGDAPEIDAIVTNHPDRIEVDSSFPTTDLGRRTSFQPHQGVPRRLSLTSPRAPTSRLMWVT